MTCNARYLHFYTARDSRLAPEAFAELNMTLCELGSLREAQTIPPGGLLNYYNFPHGRYASIYLLPCTAPYGPRTIQLTSSPDAPLEDILAAHPWTIVLDAQEYFSAEFRRETDELERVFRAATHAFRLDR